MSTTNILFYSNNCDASRVLISMMQGENLLRFFHQICTDHNKSLPEFITVTPTLMIRGIPTPYVASEAFVWFSKIKQWKIMVQMQALSAAQQQHLQTTYNNISQSDNIIGFTKTEMNSLSDMFAYLIDDSATPSSFLPYTRMSNENVDNIFTPPLEDGSYKIDKAVNYKINAAKQKNMTLALEQERRKQDDAIKSSIKEFMKQYDK